MAVAEAELDVLRPALEAAAAVARAGLRASPPSEPPPSLKPYLRFTRLRGPALAATRNAVEADEGFRSRIAGRVDPEEVGEVGFAWLSREPGWEQILAEAAAARALELEGATTEALSERIQALEAELVVVRGEQQQSDAELERLARRRDELAEQLADSAAELERWRHEHEQLSERLRSAEERAKQAELRLGQERRRRRSLQAHIEEMSPARPAHAETTSHKEPPDPPATVASPGSGHGTAADPPDTVASPGSGHRTSAPDLTHLAAGLADAGEAAALLARALTEMGASLAEEQSASPTDDRDDAGSYPPDRSEDASTEVRTRSRRRPRRRAMRLPHGLVDDEPAALEWLLGRDDLVLLIDGYNVTMGPWRDQPVSEQRRRLIEMLVASSGRHRCRVRLVFDGAEGHGGASVPPRCPIEVEFSAPDVEADDHILEACLQLPVATPVAVVSSDQRVRQGARRRGANLISSAALVEWLTGAP